MDEFIVKLLAQLDTSKVIQDYNDLKAKLEKQINIKINLDTSSQNDISKFAEQLQTALSKVSNGKLNLDISQITSALNQVSKNAQQTGKEIDNAVSQGMSQALSKSEKAINSFKQSLEKAGKSSSEIDNIINKVKELDVKIDSLHFSESTNGILNIDVSGLDQFKNKVKITQSLVQDLQTMQWKVSNTTTSIVSTKELDKIKNVFADYAQKIAQFKSTNANILSGLSVPISDFESKLVGLKNGTATVNDVINSYKNLNAEASKITENLSAQFSKVDAAVRNIAKGEETISGLRAELKGLSNSPKEINSELNKLSTSLNNIKKIEVQEGRTANWSQAYREWEQAVDSLKAKLKALKKEQVNSATTQVFNTSDLDRQGKIYIQKVSNTIEKTKSEIESKLRNAGYTDIEVKGVEDANGKIKSLTATVTDAAGAFKQLAFERAKIQNQGKAQYGFIQADDVKVIGNISSSVETVKTSLSSLKNKWAGQGVLVGEFKARVEQLETSLISVGSKGELNGLKSQLESLKNEAATISQVNKIQLSFDTGEYESKVESLIAKTQQWTDAEGNARINTTNLSIALNELTTASEAYANNPTEATQKRLIESGEKLDAEYKKITNSVRSMNAEMAKDSSIASLHNKVADFMSKNSKAVKYSGEFKRIFNETAQGAELTRQQVAKLNQEFNNAVASARQAGKLGKTWFQTLREGMSSFSYWMSSTFLVMKTIQSVKSGISTVKALDTALVDLEKTTTMTASELEDFYYASNKVAKQMGVTTEEIINQASAWSRLGYGSAEATTKMAKLSSQFALISPGMDVDKATSGLVSIMKAYDVSVDDVLEKIESKVNIIGNNLALSNDNIVSMLQDSVSAMAEGRNTLEQTIALESAAYEIVQDNSVGNGFKTVSLRLRGLNEETQELDDELKTIKGDLYDLTGVSIMEDANTYKSTYQILKEISDVWESLTDKTRAEALELMFGKLRSNVGAAVLKNFSAAERAMDLMADSAGSADRELEVVTQSMEYKLNRLSETGTSVAQNLFKRDDMKTVVDGLTSVMNVIDTLTSKLGLFGSIGLGAGLFAGFKNVGGWKNVSPICYLF